jgi:alkylation response protein AidB-like acyl-CoA dehydrogenase
MRDASVDHETHLRRSGELASVMAEHAPEGERLRRVPDATMAAVVQADVLRCATPTSLGGQGLGLDSLAHGARLMAHGCVASAWTISFLQLHGWLLSRLPAASHQELFGAGLPLAAAPLAPTGTVTPTDGGYVLSGRWEWATGVEHSNWVLVHAVQTEPEFGTRFLAVRIDEVEVDDVWHMSGMRATGSNTVHVTERFVPESRSCEASQMLLAAPDGLDRVDGDGLADHPVAAVLALVAAAPALGAAEAAVELFRSRLSERVLAYTLGDRQREQPAAQVRLATAMSDLVAARVRWDAALAELSAACADGGADEDLRVASRLSAAATVRASRQVISTVCEGAGASVYALSSPLQRLQRDVEVLKGHVIFDWDRTAELAGRHALGFELRPTDMV